MHSMGELEHVGGPCADRVDLALLILIFPKEID